MYQQLLDNESLDNASRAFSMIYKNGELMREFLGLFIFYCSLVFYILGAFLIKQLLLLRLLDMRSLSSAEASFVLLCCFVPKGRRWPGEREKWQRAGNAGKGKERREACSRPCPLPIVPSAPTIIQKFPIGSLCGGERYEIIIANSALHASLAIYHLISNARSWNNC